MVNTERRQSLARVVRIREIYAAYVNHPKIKWKDSIKEVLGLQAPTCPGLDV